MACSSGHVDVVEQLIANCANVEAKNEVCIEKARRTMGVKQEEVVLHIISIHSLKSFVRTDIFLYTSPERRNTNPLGVS